MHDYIPLRLLPREIAQCIHRQAPSVKRLWKLTSAGVLPAKQNGDTYYFAKADLPAIIEILKDQSVITMDSAGRQPDKMDSPRRKPISRIYKGPSEPAPRSIDWSWRPKQYTQQHGRAAAAAAQHTP